MRWPILLLATLLGACTCSGGSADDAARRANASLSDLSRCLLGEPLAAGERASARARAVQLLAPPPSGAGDTHAWPARCAPHARQLATDLDAAKSADAAKYGAAADQAGPIAESIARGSLPTDLDGFFATLVSAGLVPVPGSNAPPAPAPAHP